MLSHCAICTENFIALSVPNINLFVVVELEDVTMKLKEILKPNIFLTKQLKPQLMNIFDSAKNFKATHARAVCLEYFTSEMEMSVGKMSTYSSQNRELQMRFIYCFNSFFIRQ